MSGFSENVMHKWILAVMLHSVYVWRISLILAPIMSTISLRVQEKSFEKHPVLMYRETKLHGFLASAKHLKHSHYNPCKRVPNIVTVVEKFKHAVNNS